MAVRTGKVLQEHLNVGTSTGTAPRPGGGTNTGNQICLSSFARGQAAVTQSWDPGSVSPASSVTVTVSVPGAALGDHVLVSSSIDLQGLFLDAQVSSANTVTVVLANLTSAVVDLSSLTLSVLVFAVR